jgi:hypothetical protein
MRRSAARFGPGLWAVDLTVEPLTGSTSRLTIAVGFEGQGVGKILVPLVVRRQAWKEIPANLATLKRRIEARQPPPGPWAASSPHGHRRPQDLSARSGGPPG